MKVNKRQVLDAQFLEYAWLASAEGTQSPRTITLAPSLIAAAKYPQGRLPSGLYLGKVTSAGATQGQYGEYNDAAADGRQVAAGFLYGEVELARDAAGAIVTTIPIGGALLWRGAVKLAAVQTINNNVALDAAGQTDLAARFRFE
jgi:hypothetical protein